MIATAARLTAATTPERLAAMGFRPDDAADVGRLVERVLTNEADLHRVSVLADRLIAQIGWFAEPAYELFDHDLARDEHYGAGTFPMLALLITADDVVDFHRSREIPDDVSWATLADLGQQVWVHRRTYGSFGLHTQGWMTVAWSGALYALGRLQFNLHSRTEHADWWLSTHIPETGPLTPELVDDSFRRAQAFFGRHFSDYEFAGFLCDSWLLDPQLTEALGPDTNMGRFQRRWHLNQPPRPGDGDALFFTFRRRGDVDLDALPQDTTLQRAIVGKLRSGGHWYCYQGSLGFDEVPPAPAGDGAAS
ncbi:hypothetical protein FHX74_002084 [Friedmanniella endophytica]|uniref:Acyltransferase n=1 Tax=Microlunatus kandeliicorticis TaxID=1759536 RepID=A0A7W3ISK6_9ACTN|nr:acyltransferase domain-containing protein [Microlunatus kandeliicorticis]MBA8794465.1 hypothetical protein [Microlunatus kandeliicorticis]